MVQLILFQNYLIYNFNICQPSPPKSKRLRYNLQPFLGSKYGSESQQKLIQKLNCHKLTVANNQIKMSKTHTCYFHKNKPITSFCTLPHCTLPMCQECLPIHSQEHEDDHTQATIISFEKAEEKAVSCLKMHISSLSKNQKQCEQALSNAKDKLFELVNTFVRQQESVLKTMFQSLEETEKKLKKIQKGSLKSLIYFYSTEQLKSQQFERISLAYRESMEEKVRKGQQNLASNNFTASLYEMKKKDQPELTTVREIRAISSTDNLRQKYQNEKAQQNNREFGRERQEKGSDFSRERERDSRGQVERESKEYQHRQIFTQKSSQNLEIHSKKKLYNEERPRESQQHYARNRIYTQVETKPERKSSYETGSNRRPYQVQNTDDYLREEWKPLDTFEPKKNLQTYNSKPDFIKIQEEWSRKPLQPSDLNLEYTNSVRVNMSKGKDVSNTHSLKTEEYNRLDLYKNNNREEVHNRHEMRSREQGSHHRTELNKEVLSPQEIRKMLEKRIEERSRIITKSKAAASKNEETGQEYERNWDTKDSIINQIYSDYRY